jgi:hypothetical protein
MPEEKRIPMSFFSKIESFLKKVFGSAKWENIARATLTVVAPLTETIVGLVAGEPAAAALGALINQIQSDLGVAATVIGQADQTPTLTGALTAVQSNLQAILTAGHITDPTTLQKVTAVVNTVAGEIEAVQKTLPAAV